MNNSVFLPWIDINKLDMRIISTHKEAVSFFEKNPNYICWDTLSANDAAIDLIKSNLNKVNWSALSRNSAAIEILFHNKDKIDWNELGYNASENTYLLYEGNIDKVTNWLPVCKNRSAWINTILDGQIDRLSEVEICELSSNEAAIPIIKKYLPRMSKYGLLKNTYIQQGIYGNSFPVAFKLFTYLNNKIIGNYCTSSVFVTYLKHNPDKIDQYIYLNHNPHALDLIINELQLEDNIEELDYEKWPYWWPYLSSNPVIAPHLTNYTKYICWDEYSKLEEAISIIETNLDKINWNSLSENKAAMHILETHIDKINWSRISHNRGIYSDQSLYIKEKMELLCFYSKKEEEYEMAYNTGELPYISFDGIIIQMNENLGSLGSYYEK